MSRCGYCMIDSFNKYLLRVYYMPGGKFNESLKSKANVTAPYK